MIGDRCESAWAGITGALMGTALWIFGAPVLVWLLDGSPR